MLPLVLLPDERLFAASAEITEINEEIQRLAEEMIETMRAADGVGLAAVQVGVMSRLFVTQVGKDEARVFINPYIETFSDRTGPYEEGCLSIPGVYSDVIRPLEVRIRARGLDGNDFAIDAEGLLARVVQHELDHLNGVLFYQHLKPRHQERFVKAYARSRGLDEKVVMPLRLTGSKH